VDYDLTRLGTREFEHLTQALALAVFGANVEVFGDGPDGGREASYTGILRWSENQTWDGYTVVQAKYLARPKSTDVDTVWLLKQLNSELKHWTDPNSRRRKRGKMPEYLLVSTNVTLSSPEGGGIETVGARLERHAEALGLRGWGIWHYDKINRLLDNAADIRATFSGLITPGDVLAQLRAMLVGTAADLGQLLSAHATKDLLADQSVRLGQAGAPDNERLALANVGVDLLARPQGTDSNENAIVPAVSHIVAHGDGVWRPSIVGQNARSHIVLVGGPGQGKTTLGQLLAQTYRIALLAEANLVGEAARIRAATRERLAAIGVPTPASKRWAVRVELAAYGDAIAGGADISLLRFIAQDVSRRGGAEISGAQLAEWLKRWPWLVVLDGLDEVAALPAREQLMRQISEFLIDAAASDADLLLVATTRPQGYAGEFASEDYRHLTLAPLTPAAAVAYAKHLAEVRLFDDPDLQQQVIE
jgi:hypothetical protein